MTKRFLGTATTAACAAAVFVLAPRASAQSFNINFAPAGAGPSSAYAGAANQPGVWNVMFPPHGAGQFPLVGLDGGASAVTIANIGGTALLAADDPATAGDDGALLDHYMVTFSASLESCLFFRNLTPGTYEVTMYCWTPTRPDVDSYATCDQSATGAQVIGGGWSGQHALGVTYSRHMAIVGADGRLNTHSGIVPGHNAADGAALNGVQIRLIPPCPADLNGDGAVGAPDLALLLGGWGAGGAGDLDGSGSVGAPDLALLLGAWGACP